MRWGTAVGLWCVAGFAIAGDDIPVARFVDWREQLRIDFPRPMRVIANDEVGRAVRIVPEIPGKKCWWDDDATIACSFSKPGLRATAYNITLAPGVLRTTTGETLSVRRLLVTTRRPEVTAEISRWERAVPDFSVDVEGATQDALAEVLRLDINGKAVPVRLTRREKRYGTGDSYSVALPAMRPQAIATLRVVPGLRPDEGTLRGTDDRVLLRALVGEPFRVRAAACTGEQAPITAAPAGGRIELAGCMAGDPVRLFLSRDTTMKAWKPHMPAGVEVAQAGARWGGEPWSNKALAQFAPDHFVDLLFDTANVARDLRIEGIVAADTQETIEPIELRVATTSPRAAVRGERRKALLVPGTPLPWIVANLPPQQLDATAIATKAERLTLRTPAATDMPVRLTSPPLQSALDAGGLVQLAPHVVNGDVARQTVSANAPAFDVLLQLGTREGFAWAHDWENGAPIRDADAELLFVREAGATPEVVTRAKTDAQGLARFDLPDTFVATVDEKKERSFLVRMRDPARTGASLAVIPHVLSRWGGNFGMQRTAQLWGVSDKPLYRAGDVVHWKAWLREPRDGRMVAPKSPGPQTIVLANEDGQPFITFTPTPDASGAMRGEFRLPIHLVDGTYCLEYGEDDDGGGRETGPCFGVGDYNAQDLWLRASSSTTLAREGGTAVLDIDAGYYSGGPAAGAELTDFSGNVEQRDFADVHPQWRGFAFGSDRSRFGYTEIEAPEDEEIDAVADAGGRAYLAIPVRTQVDETDDEEVYGPPTYGVLTMTVDVAVTGRDPTTSNAVEVPWARFAHYVGLKVAPEWPNADGPIRMQAIVAAADGAASNVGDTIDVEVAFRATHGGDPERMHVCKLVAGADARECTFPRTRTGWYEITARHGDAEPAVVLRWISARDDDAEPEKVEPALIAVRDDNVAGAKVRLMLRQGEPHASVLLTARANDQVLAAQVFEVDSPAEILELQTEAHWPGHVILNAQIRPARPAQATPEGFRDVVQTESVAGYIALARPVREPPIALTFAPQRAAPTDVAHLTLRNTTDIPRTVTLTVLDDAVRALGANYDSRFEPTGPEGAFDTTWGNGDTVSFNDWARGNAWRWVVDPETKCDATQAACALKWVERDERGRVDLYSVSSYSIIGNTDATSSTGAPGYARKSTSDVDGVSELASAEVVGTGAIRPVSDPEVPPPPRGLDARPDAVKPLDPTLARVRVQFAETIAWRDDIVLAPGASQVIELRLPDNIGRWRAISWSDDGGWDIARSDATLEAGLPVEARLQAPARVYPGDTARITANARQVGDHATTADLRLTIEHDGDITPHTAMLSLAPAGQAAFGADFAPAQPGRVLLTAAAATVEGRDAVAVPMDVASTEIAGSRLQAGWLEATPLQIDLPALPDGAHDAHARLVVWRGHDALVDEWTQRMREYPHRCWEQILSRAVAAALAIERGDTFWPDAEAVVQEALDNAAVFQDDDGGMAFFARQGYGERWTSVPLTAWTVEAFGLLRATGHAPPADVERKAREWLKEGGPQRAANAESVAIAASVETGDKASLDRMVEKVPAMNVPGRVAAARALANMGDARAADVVRALLDEAPKRGAARVLRSEGRFAMWMSSPMREQCELVRLLQEHPALASDGTRMALVAGLVDLYSGGTGGNIDTQAAATCLRALRGERANLSAEVGVDARIGDESHALVLAQGAKRTETTFAAAPTGALSLAASKATDTPVAYLARIDFREDARVAQSTSVGFTLGRRYEVLRDNQWMPIEAPLRHGDWVRITLVLENASPRGFVAVTDDVPGGLRPVDLTLAGVAGVNMEMLANEGDSAFSQRKLDARQPKFYAAAVEAGRHEIHYFARVANTGDYLAAPAVAELMYGEASRARTAADRLVIADPDAPTQPAR